MFEMSKIEKLIKQYCPNGVEYKELGEVCLFQNGFAFKSSLFKDEGLPILRITNIQNKGIDASNLVYFNIDDYKVNLEQFKVKENDIVIAMSGATTGKVGINKSKQVYYLNQRVGKFVPNSNIIVNGYLYHFIQTKSQEILAISSGSGAQPNLSSEQLKKIRIPVPPLPVQEEIVKILDAFTSLEAELEAELEARKKQYEYYRNKLLMFDENTTGGGIKFMQLGDVYDFQYGKGNTIPTIGGEYPVYGSNGIVGTHNEYNSEDAPVIGHIGAYAGIVNYGYGKHFVTYNGVICKIKTKEVLPKYGYYLLLLQNFMDKAKEGSQPFISYDILKEPTVAIPPLDEQERIVAILDKFDSLVNDISEGLPAEINARKQQYEHYRNQLLTFDEVA